MRIGNKSRSSEALGFDLHVVDVDLGVVGDQEHRAQAGEIRGIVAIAIVGGVERTGHGNIGSLSGREDRVKTHAHGFHIESQLGNRPVLIGQQRVLLDDRAVFDVVADAEIVVTAPREAGGRALESGGHGHALAVVDHILRCRRILRRQHRRG